MRRSTTIAVLLPGALLLAALVPAHAYVPRLSLEDMARRSTLAVTGRVIEMKSYIGPFHDVGEVMFTDVTVRIERVLQGTPRTDEVTIQVLGGRIGSAFQHCPESARYEPGERVLVFLREYNGKLWNTGWLQGKYSLAADGVTVKGKEHFPIDRDVDIETLRGRLLAMQPTMQPTIQPTGQPTGQPAIQPTGESTGAAPAGASPRIDAPAAEASGKGGVR